MHLYSIITVDLLTSFACWHAIVLLLVSLVVVARYFLLYDVMYQSYIKWCRRIITIGK
jgi:hypothetical protein